MSVQQKKSAHLHLEATQKRQPYKSPVIFKTLTFRNSTEKATIQNTTNIQDIDI